MSANREVYGIFKSPLTQRPETIDKAVLFLGWATILLAAGSILLAALGKTVPEALWGALGAGIGGLAGIFMGRQ